MDYTEVSNIKCAALSYAIKSACGTKQDGTGFVTTDPDELIKAAKIFEAYINGEINADKT